MLKRKGGEGGIANGKTSRDIFHLFHTAVLPNPVITDNIFDFLPFKDILTTSSVSKDWNKVSRTYLRTRRKCFLCFPKSLCNLKSVEEIREVLKNPELVHPFNGLCFCFTVSQVFGCFAVELLLDSILKTVVIKGLVVHVKVQEETSMYQEILERIVPLIAKVVEFVEIKSDSSNVFALSPFFEVESFPKLKHLKMINTGLPLLTSTYARILQAAPKLKLFSGRVVVPHLQTFLDQGKSHILEHLEVDLQHLTVEDVSSVVVPFRVLTVALLRSIAGLEWQIKLSSLLKNLSNSLQVFEMDIKALKVFIDTHFIPVLPHVQKLICRVEHKIDIFPVFQNVNFARVFPSVTAVEFHWRPSGNWAENQISEWDDSILCPAIKTLILSNPVTVATGWQNNLQLYSLVQVFPKVTQIIIDGVTDLNWYLNIINKSPWGEILERLVLTNVQSEDRFERGFIPYYNFLCLTPEQLEKFKSRPKTRFQAKSKSFKEYIFLDALSSLYELRVDFTHTRSKKKQVICFYWQSRLGDSVSIQVRDNCSNSCCLSSSGS